MRVVALVFLPLLLGCTFAQEDELGQLLRIARERMRCKADSKCLEKTGVQRLLRTKDFKSIDRGDLGVVIAHHFLHGDSACTSKASGLEILEEEVMRAIETEDISGILRIFKRILKDVGPTKSKCVTTESILQEMPASSHNLSSMQWMRSVLSLLMEHVIKGSCIDNGTPLKNSLDDLFNRYGDTCSPYLSIKGLKDMMHDLEGAGATHDHNQHKHHHSENHNHNEECDHNDHHEHHDHPHHSDEYHSDQYLSHEHSKENVNNHDYPDHYPHNHLDHDHDNLNHSAHEDFNHNEYRNQNQSDNHQDHQHHGGHEYTDYNHDINNTAYHNYINHNDSDHNQNYHKLDFFQSENAVNTEKPESMSANQTKGSDINATGNYTEVFEELVPSILSNLWHPTTLASEESDSLSITLPPISTHPSALISSCLSAEILVTRYGYDRISISKAEFMRLCPVLVQQTVGDSCEETSAISASPSKLEVYGYGSIAVFVLCLASLSGILLLPLMKRNARHYVIAGFQGLAISTLASDALLHLLPEFLGLHSHGSSGGHVHESFPEPYAQLLLGVLATIYVLFMTEAVLTAVYGHSHSHSHGSDGNANVHQLSEPTLMSVKGKSPSQLPIATDQSCSSLDTEIVEIDSIKKPPNLMVSQPIICGLTSMALVITLGDALHNFGDGLAIGAAFSANIRGGLSTTAAALCHELPHELGDFVVLLSTGLSYSKALWLNFLSGLTCFGGLYIGILIGDNEEARKWVMAVTTSTFLYVALAQMIPELREHRNGSPFKMLLVKNIGIIAGVAIMCTISIYEQQME